jgi:hypothetical protein
VEHRDGGRKDGGAGWLQLGAVKTRRKQGGLKQQAGRFVCTADGNLLLIHVPPEVEDDEKGDAGGAGARAPLSSGRLRRYRRSIAGARR